EVCGGPIPSSRKASAIYCSTECKIRSRRSLSVKARNGQQEYNRRYLYGITTEQYEAMLAGQDNRCAICRSPDWPGKGNRPCVDRARDRGRVGGRLCGTCNTGIGQLHHDPARLRAAADYLERAARENRLSLLHPLG